MNQYDDWNDKHDDDGAQKTDANVDDPVLLLARWCRICGSHAVSFDICIQNEASGSAYSKIFLSCHFVVQIKLKDVSRINTLSSKSFGSNASLSVLQHTTTRGNTLQHVNEFCIEIRRDSNPRGGILGLMWWEHSVPIVYTRVAEWFGPKAFRDRGFLPAGSNPSVFQCKIHDMLQCTATHCNTLCNTLQCSTFPRAHRSCIYIYIYVYVCVCVCVYILGIPSAPLCLSLLFSLSPAPLPPTSHLRGSRCLSLAFFLSLLLAFAAFSLACSLWHSLSLLYHPSFRYSCYMRL